MSVAEYFLGVAKRVVGFGHTRASMPRAARRAFLRFAPQCVSSSPASRVNAGFGVGGQLASRARLSAANCTRRSVEFADAVLGARLLAVELLHRKIETMQRRGGSASASRSAGSADCASA